METVYDKAMRAAVLLCPDQPGKRRNRNFDGYDEAYKAFREVAEPLVTGSQGCGPDIERLLRIAPLAFTRGKDEYLSHIKPVDPYSVAFTWDPKFTKPADDMNPKPIGTIKTLHRYAYYGFFKPSIAEVLSQIPDDLVERTAGFSVSGPDSADDLNDELLALDAGFHIATTTLYEKRSAGR